MKKLTLLIIAIFFLLSCSAITGFAAAENGAHIPGDLDGDGAVTAADARICLRASSRLVNLTEEQKSAADVDEDGSVTAADARIILRYSSRLIPAFSYLEIYEAVILSKNGGAATLALTVKNKLNKDIGGFQLLISCFNKNGDILFSSIENTYYPDGGLPNNGEYNILKDISAYKNAAYAEICMIKYQPAGGAPVELSDPEFIRYTARPASSDLKMLESAIFYDVKGVFFGIICRNLTNLRLGYFELEVKCYDKNKNPVNAGGGNAATLYREYKDGLAQGGEDEIYWSISEFTGVEYIEFCLIKYITRGGIVAEFPEAERVWFSAEIFKK